MADVFSKKKRSEVMARIRASGTRIEDVLFRAVTGASGPRRRVIRNAKALPGHPDVVIPSLKVAIFADGCFYHGCPRHGRVPQSNVDYWLPKLQGNMTRDRRNRKMLRRRGYSVWRFWEHDLEGLRAVRTEKTIHRRLERARLSP